MVPFNSNATTKSQHRPDVLPLGKQLLDPKRKPAPRMKEVFSIGTHDLDIQFQGHAHTSSSQISTASQRSTLGPEKLSKKCSSSTIKQMQASNTITPQSIFNSLALSKQLGNVTTSADDLRVKKKEVLKNYLRVQTHLNVSKGNYGAVSGFPDMQTLMPNLVEVDASDNKLGIHHFIKFNCAILRLSSNLITDDVIERSLELHGLLSQTPEKLEKASLFKTLRVIDLSNNLIENFYTLCALLSKFPLLQTVILSNNSLQVPTINIEGAQLTVDEYLKLDHLVRNIPPYTNDGYIFSLPGTSDQFLPSGHANIPVVTSATTLVMDGIPMNSSFFSAIARAFPNLERLSIRGCNIHYSFLSSLLKFPTIVELDLSDNPDIGCVDHLKSYALHAPSKNLSIIRAHNSIGTVSTKEGPVHFLWLDFDGNLISESRNPYFQPESAFRTIEISLFQSSGIRHTLRSGEVVPIKIDTSLPKIPGASKPQCDSVSNVTDVASSLRQLTNDIEGLEYTDLDKFNQKTTITESVLDTINNAMEKLKLVSDEANQSSSMSFGADPKSREIGQTSKSVLSAPKPLSSYLITTADTMNIPNSTTTSSQQSRNSHGSISTGRDSGLSSKTRTSKASKSSLSIAAILGGIGASSTSIVAAPTLGLSAPSISSDFVGDPTRLGLTPVPFSAAADRPQKSSKNLLPNANSPPRSPLYKRPDSTRRNLILGTGQTAVDEYLLAAKEKYANNSIIMRALASVKSPIGTQSHTYPILYDKKASSVVAENISDNHSSNSTFAQDSMHTPRRATVPKQSIDTYSGEESPLMVYKLHLQSEDRGTFDASFPASYSIHDKALSKGGVVQDMDLTDETLAAELVTSFVRTSICGMLNKSAPASFYAQRLSLIDDVSDISDPSDIESFDEVSKSAQIVEHEKFVAAHSIQSANDGKHINILRAQSAPPRYAAGIFVVEPESSKDSVPFPGPSFTGANTFITGTDYIQEISDIEEEHPASTAYQPGLFDDTLLTKRIREGIEMITGPVDVAGILQSDSPQERDILSFLPWGRRSSLRDIYTALRVVLENPITTYAAITDEEILVSLLQQVKVN
ncbi:Hypothetical protein GLP15_3635 [Giardia lamblia P15]|uniref:Leucine-rich repeat protein n=1 Tax=Giardia intestinalis (strain P15) TaxID=658858 RepID=E1F687_GIAIA|nr:Hypothetical protein GLP15_3635 [Giardia lamblia P15]